MEILQDLEDMEIDTSKKILDWEAIWIAKSKALVENLPHEGPISFEDESHCTILVTKRIQGRFSYNALVLKGIKS